MYVTLKERRLPITVRWITIYWEGIGVIQPLGR